MAFIVTPLAGLHGVLFGYAKIVQPLWGCMVEICLKVER